ncbi:MAG: hypothetical protein CL824_00990 [Crocinitomicaceae bacterium]|nr:hypothetical protein [Crocinitomicaceae bacterium]
MKALLRKILRPIVYIFTYLPFKRKVNVTRAGTPLKKGISAVVAMKNEEYILPLCLKSLVGFADQVIIIDNGSDDDSLLVANEFKEKFNDKIQVDIVELPNALLGDCREKGLELSEYQWHLRWDADMVAYTSGNHDMKILREKALNDNTPRAIQLPRLNLNGDLSHHEPDKLEDPGEPILIWLTKDVIYKEFGKFDTIRVPFYYQQVQETHNYYFHCQGLKSIDNLMHRFHYFTWRELINSIPEQEQDERIKNYEVFKNLRNEYLFHSKDINTIKFRYQKQLFPKFIKLGTQNSYPYPDVIKEEIDSGNERFKILYENGKPYSRKDSKDFEMENYSISEEDEKWSISEFMDRLLNENYKDYIK